MTNFKTYFYYSKHDSKKEAIDRVKTATEEDAVTYFAGRKKIEEEVFKNLYNVESYEETKPQ